MNLAAEVWRCLNGQERSALKGAAASTETEGRYLFLQTAHAGRLLSHSPEPLVHELAVGRFRRTAWGDRVIECSRGDQ